MFFFFFFFKQKTAYEIMPSLVGSEMCIRDRRWSGPGRASPRSCPGRRPCPPVRPGGRRAARRCRRRVGPEGKAYGLDMTEEMLALARTNAAKAGATNVEFLQGHIEEIPLPALAALVRARASISSVMSR